MIIQYLEYQGGNAGIQKQEKRELFLIAARSAAFAIYCSATALRLTYGFPCFLNF